MMRLANVKNMKAKKGKPIAPSAIMLLCQENIPQTRGKLRGGGFGRQQFIISDSLAGHTVWCSVIQLSSKSPPPEFPRPWLDLDAACIHHCPGVRYDTLTPANRKSYVSYNFRAIGL